MPSEKCEPQKCAYFKRLYEAAWNRMPADRIFMRCSARDGLKCLNSKRKKLGRT